METLESIQRGVRTAEDLHSLVKTMKVLAAVNIRRLERAVESLAEYSRTIELGLVAVLREHPEAIREKDARRPSRLGTIVFGSDQGMCGSLNDQIAAFALKTMNDLSGDRSGRATLAVGSRPATRLEEAGEQVEAILPIPGSVGGITALVQQILVHVERWRFQHGVERIVLCHCERLARGNFRPRATQLTPFDHDWLESLVERHWRRRALPAFTMDGSKLFSHLTRQYLFVSLYRAIAESMASENASRLASMRGAERNIKDRVVDLSRRFHQRRQMAITEELLDIVSGFEALGGES
ncbi:MAG: F0F1 ATP synthase subunit gamma [Planctomycetales bacterium]